MKVEVSLDSINYEKKPDKFIEISKRIPKNVVYESITFIAGKVSSGYAFCPAVFDPCHRSKENVKSMQLYGLDFDDQRLSYGEIKQRLNSFSIPISFSYHTYSSTQTAPRMRVVICHAVPITNSNISEFISSMLKKIFPEADPLCFDISRMFLGGIELIEVNEDAVFNLAALSEEFQLWLRTKDAGNYGREINSIAHRYRIATDNNCFMISTVTDGEILSKNLESEEKWANNIKEYIEISQNSSILIINEKEVYIDHHQMLPCERSKNKDKIRHVMEEDIYSKCRLFCDAVDGKDIGHSGRFILATNLQNIKGGRSMFLKCIQNSGGDTDKWKAAWKYISDMLYKPQLCEDNCPYAKECRHKKNMCLTVDTSSKINVVEQQKYVSIEESYSYMKNALISSVEDEKSDNDIILIKGQTGIGKTAAYLDLMRHTSKLLIIAVPTIILKNEIAGKAGSLAVASVSVEDLGLPHEVYEQVKELYDNSFYKDARKVIKDYEKELPEGYEFMRENIENYLNPANIFSSKKHIIMTHAQLENMNEEKLKGYSVIVDEDIMYSIFKSTASMSKADIADAIKQGMIYGKRAAQLSDIIRTEDRYYKADCEPDEFYVSKEMANERSISGNINDIMHAGSYYSSKDDVSFFICRQLPKVHMIIMSATIEDELYRSYFKDRKIIFYDTPPAKYSGRLIQYTAHSMSRQDICILNEKYGSYHTLFDRLLKITGKVHYEIGFMKYEGMSEVSDHLHFGNCSGIDRYKNKNGIIVGTPHMREEDYKLMATYLGENVNGDRIKRRMITHKGFRFCMMSYSNDRLRRIQLYFIDSELEQAIGRSRLLRAQTSTTVYLFSNYPCEQAKLIQDDYLEEEASVSSEDTLVLDNAV